MRNRFGVNEEEKNRIRGLHKNLSIIKEQDGKETPVTDADLSKARFLKTMVVGKVTIEELQNLDVAEYSILIKLSKEWKKHFEGYAFSSYQKLLKFIIWQNKDDFSDEQKDILGLKEH